MVADPLVELGSKIADQRKSLKLSIEDVASASRVSAKYVKAIEEADRENLPEEVYLIGFLNLILKELKLNKSEILEDYKDKESYHIIQQILNDQKDEPKEFASEAINTKNRKFPDSSKYFKIYQLYVLAFIVILSFSFILINKFNGKKFQATNASQALSNEEIVVESEATNSLVIPLAPQKPEKEEAKKIAQEKEKSIKKEKDLTIARKKKPSQIELTEQIQKLQKIAAINPLEDPVEIARKLKDEEARKLNKLKEELEKENKGKNRLVKAGSGSKILNLKVEDTAWFQVIGVGQSKILVEGDVFANYGPNLFTLYDPIGFVVATGNAGAFLYQTAEDRSFNKLGRKDQLVKWYYPKEAKEAYTRAQTEKEQSLNQASN